jgi:LemA protein
VVRNANAASRRYQEHERETIKDIVDARAAVAQSKVVNDKVSALDKFDLTVRNLFVNIEQYPNLKADQLVLELMKNITSTEEALLKEKTEYNARVVEYNKSIRLLPYMIIARYYNFTPKQMIHKENNADIYDARKLLEENK